MDDLLQTHNEGGFAELLKHGDLSDGSAGDAIITVINLDLFDGRLCVEFAVSGEVDDAVGALTEALDILEIIFFDFLGCLDRPIFSARSGIARLFLLFGLDHDIGKELGRLGGCGLLLALDHGYVFSHYTVAVCLSACYAIVFVWLL